MGQIVWIAAQAVMVIFFGVIGLFTLVAIARTIIQQFRWDALPHERRERLLLDALDAALKLTLAHRLIPAELARDRKTADQLVTAANGWLRAHSWPGVFTRPKLLALHAHHRILSLEAPTLAEALGARGMRPRVRGSAESAEGGE